MTAKFRQPVAKMSHRSQATQIAVGLWIICAQRLTPPR